MPWMYLYKGIIFIIAIFPLLGYYFYNLNLGRGKKLSIKRFLYHVKQKRLLHTPVVLTFLAPYYLTIIILIFCYYSGLFHNEWESFKELMFPFVSLLPNLIFTSTTFIAVFGPTILSLNYRLFKAQIREEKDSNYSRLYRSTWKRYIDAQLDHTNQLNSLTIAWGAFTYQIIMSPIFEIINIANSIKIISLKSEFHSLDSCLVDEEYTYGNAFNSFQTLIQTDFLSVLIILVSFGFVSWAFIRLISGQLSKSDVVKLYERNDNDNLTYPTIASRITLYRYIIILFSFLYMAWSEIYVACRERDILISKFSEKTLIEKMINTQTNLPAVPVGIYFILFIVSLLVTIFVAMHYFENFKYELSAKLRYNSEIDEEDKLAPLI